MDEKRQQREQGEVAAEHADGGSGVARHGNHSHATPVPPGRQAPDFCLRATPDQELSLDDFRGKPLVLAFYPADWSPVCGDQMALYNEILPEFHRLGAELVGVSVDGVWCHTAFAHDRKLRFPLLSDFEPKGAVARSYGVYREHEGTTERALFVLDGDGVVRWSYVSPVGVNPGADGILAALEGMSSGDASRAAAASSRPAPEPPSPTAEARP